MRPQPGVFALFVSLVLLVMAMGMIQAWIWAIVRFRQGLPLLPARKPRVAPWGGLSVLMVLLTWFAINFGVGLIWVGITSGRGRGRTLSLTEQMFLMCVINGLVLLLVPPLLRLTARASLADLGIRWADLGQDAWTGVMAFLLFTPVVYALNGLAILIWSPSKHPLEQMVSVERSGGSFALAFLSAVLLAPAAEELIFRGVFQSWLSRWLGDPEDRASTPLEDDQFLLDALDWEAVELGIAPVGNGPEDEARGSGEPPVIEASVLTVRRPRPSWLPQLPRPIRAALERTGWARMLPIVITSALFAVVHLPQWPAPLAIFFLSLGLGMVFQRSGSLISSIVMHALFNTVATLLLFAAVLSGALPPQ